MSGGRERRLRLAAALVADPLPAGADRGVFLTAGTLLMIGISSTLAGAVAAALFGFGIGGMLTLLPIAWADYFGRANYGAIRGARAVGAGAGAGRRPAAVGRIARLDRQLHALARMLRGAVLPQHPGGAGARGRPRLDNGG